MTKLDFFRRRLQDFDCCTEETRRMRLEVLKDLPAASGFRAKVWQPCSKCQELPCNEASDGKLYCKL